MISMKAIDFPPLLNYNPNDIRFFIIICGRPSDFIDLLYQFIICQIRISGELTISIFSNNLLFIFSIYIYD